MTEELLGIALGVQEPVYTEEVSFDRDKGELHIRMNFRRGGLSNCSECNTKDLPVRDTAEKT